MNKHIENFWLGTLAGAAVGIAAGIMLAPKSGKEIRNDISSGVKNIADGMQNKLGNFKESAVEIVSKAEKNTSHMAEDTKKKIGNILEQGDAAKGEKHWLRTLAGTAVGVTAGIMLAPKSGKEIRNDISSGMKNIADEMQNNLEDFKENVLEIVSEVKENTSHMAEETKKKIGNILEQGETAKENIEHKKNKAMI